jgi:hypothetical protein
MGRATGDDIDMALLAESQQLFAPSLRIVMGAADNGAAVIFEMVLKKQGLGLKIVVKIRVVIQMILTEIGEQSVIKAQRPDPLLGKGMGRYLHDQVTHPRIGHFPKQTIEYKRLRRGMGGRPADASTISAAVSIRPPYRLPPPAPPFS